MALEIWYDQRPANDFGEGDPAIVVETPEQMEAFIERVRTETTEATVPPMVEISVRDDPMQGALYAGIGQEVGWVQFLLPEPVHTVCDANSAGTVTYDYMRHPHKVAANIEIGTDEVCRILSHFAHTGRRLESAKWEL